MKPNLPLLLMVAIFGLGGELAFGQQFGPPSAPRAPRPTLSPYLNLLNRNNSSAFNYYNFVRPRENFNDYRGLTNQSLSSLQKQIDQTDNALRQSENSQLNPSGHTTTFMNLGGYFGRGPTGGGR